MAATDNDGVIVAFYDAFGRRDGEAMAALYAPEVRFSDPVFPELRGSRAGAMWRMLTSRSTDLSIELVEHGATGDRGSARWVARYTFTQTGRSVRNDVRATMRLRDGLITEHVDSFGFHAWARQALGPPGLLLGWTPIIRSAVRRRAAASLEEFVDQSPGGSSPSQ